MAPRGRSAGHTRPAHPVHAGIGTGGRATAGAGAGCMALAGSQASERTKSAGQATADAGAAPAPVPTGEPGLSAESASDAVSATGAAAVVLDTVWKIGGSHPGAPRSVSGGAVAVACGGTSVRATGAACSATDARPFERPLADRAAPATEARSSPHDGHDSRPYGTLALHVAQTIDCGDIHHLGSGSTPRGRKSCSVAESTPLFHCPSGSYPAPPNVPAQSTVQTAARQAEMTATSTRPPANSATSIATSASATTPSVPNDNDARSASHVAEPARPTATSTSSSTTSGTAANTPQRSGFRTSRMVARPSALGTRSPSRTTRRAAIPPIVSPSSHAATTATTASGGAASHPDDERHANVRRHRQLAVRDGHDADRSPRQGEQQGQVGDEPSGEHAGGRVPGREGIVRSPTRRPGLVVSRDRSGQLRFRGGSDEAPTAQPQECRETDEGQRRSDRREAAEHDRRQQRREHVPHGDRARQHDDRSENEQETTAKEERGEGQRPGPRSPQREQERGDQGRPHGHGAGLTDGAGDPSPNSGASSPSLCRAASTLSISSPYRAKSPSRNAACASSK